MLLQNVSLVGSSVHDRYTDRVKFPSHEIQHQTRTDNKPAIIEASQAYQAISWHDYL